MSENLSTGRILSEKKLGGTVLISEKMEMLCAELNAKAEVATSSYSAAVDLLQYIYSTLVANEHWKVRPRSLVHEFFFANVF